MDSDSEQFDDDWINKYENEEKKYEIFYPEEVKYLKVNCLYINKKNELEKITEKEINLNKGNKIEKEELVKLIRENDKIDKTKYKLISILIYNFNLENNELKNFLKDNQEFNLLTNLKNIDDYTFESSLSYFHNLNNIYIVFNALEKNNIPNTKRVRFNIQKGKTRKKKI
jgi:hypothetical protein|uniref:Uncharacterized protein n=1 Tax=viral metagenome TaxID=1070528 RepID=A0A6C0CY31_9ZZZZ